MTEDEQKLNYTLYISNINEKIPKVELRKTLQTIFSQWGNVLSVYVSKALKLRGQAWVIFDNIDDAATAMDDLDGFPLHEKPLRIRFSNKKSDIIAKAEGAFVARPKYDKKQRKAEVKAELNKKRKLKDAANAPAPAVPGPAAPSAPAQQAAPQIAPAPGPAWTPAIAAAPGPAAPSFGAARPAADAPALPHKILFVQGLPEDVEHNLVNSLFSQFPGFKEVRMVPARPGIAFIEFESEAQAAMALAAMNGYSVKGTHPIAVTYAKR